MKRQSQDIQKSTRILNHAAKSFHKNIKLILSKSSVQKDKKDQLVEILKQKTIQTSTEIQATKKYIADFEAKSEENPSDMKIKNKLRLLRDQQVRLISQVRDLSTYNATLRNGQEWAADPTLRMEWANQKINNMMNDVSNQIETKGTAMLQKVTNMQDDFLTRYKKLLDQVGGVKKEPKKLPSKHRLEFSYTPPPKKYQDTTPSLSPSPSLSNAPSASNAPYSFTKIPAEVTAQYEAQTTMPDPINTRPPRVFDSAVPKAIQTPKPKPVKSPPVTSPPYVPPPRQLNRRSEPAQDKAGSDQSPMNVRSRLKKVSVKETTASTRPRSPIKPKAPAKAPVKNPAKKGNVQKTHPAVRAGIPYEKYYICAFLQREESPNIDWEAMTDDAIHEHIDIFTRYLKAFADIGNADTPINVVPAHHLIEMMKQKKDVFDTETLKTNLKRVMELTGYFLGKMATEIKENLFEVKWHYYKETSFHPRHEVPPELLDSSSGDSESEEEDE